MCWIAALNNALPGHLRPNWKTKLRMSRSALIRISRSVIDRVDEVGSFRLDTHYQLTQLTPKRSPWRIMVQDRLVKAVVGRLKELGLPPSLIDVGDFRDKFFGQQWLMFVRDQDEIADVHLVQLPHGANVKCQRKAGERVKRS